MRLFPTTESAEAEWIKNYFLPLFSLVRIGKFDKEIFSFEGSLLGGDFPEGIPMERGGFAFVFHSTPSFSSDRMETHNRKLSK